MGSKSGEGGDVSAAAPCNAVMTEEQRERREQRFNQMASQTVLQKGRPAAGSASARDGRRGGGGERGQGQGEESKSRIRPPSLREGNQFYYYLGYRLLTANTWASENPKYFIPR